MDFRLSGMDLSGCDPKAPRQWTQSLLYNENIIVVVVVQSIVSTTNQWTWLNGKKSGGILSLFQNCFRCKQFDWIRAWSLLKCIRKVMMMRSESWNGMGSFRWVLANCDANSSMIRELDVALNLCVKLFNQEKRRKKIDVKNGNHWEFCSPLALIVWNLRLLQTTSFEMEPILSPVNILPNCGTLFPGSALVPFELKFNFWLTRALALAHDALREHVRPLSSRLWILSCQIGLNSITHLANVDVLGPCHCHLNESQLYVCPRDACPNDCPSYSLPVEIQRKSSIIHVQFKKSTKFEKMICPERKRENLNKSSPFQRELDLSFVCLELCRLEFVVWFMNFFPFCSGSSRALSFESCKNHKLWGPSEQLEGKWFDLLGLSTLGF